ncbi:MAG: hypothetical protein ACLRZ9_10565 [Eubacterium sp.]
MRKIIGVILAIVIAVEFTGCENAQSGKTADQEIQSNTGQTESNDVPTEKNKINLTFTKKESGENYCSNEKGFYYIDTHGDEFTLKDGTLAYHIMYVDFATKKEVYLCSNSGCKHETDSCTSVISNKDGTEPILFLHNETLYLLRKDDDMEGTSSINKIFEDEKSAEEEQSSSQILYKMKLDGTGRTKIYEFEKGIIVEDQILQDDFGLYFVTKKLKTIKGDKNITYNTVSEKKLIKIDDDTEKKEVVCDLNIGDEKSVWSIVGCFDSTLVMEGYIADHQLSEEERIRDMEDKEFSRELALKSKTEFDTVDMETGEVKKVCSFSNKNFNNGYTIVDNCLYYMMDGKKKIHKMNLDTGEKGVLTEFSESGISFYKSFDGMLCCDNWGQESKDYFYFVDLNNGKISKSGLTTKTLGWPIEFRGETKDKVLVVYDYVASKTETDDDSYEISQNKLALIDKEDLYNGIGNFVPIDMIGSGGAID